MSDDGTLARFGFTIELRVDEQHSYTVKSPPIEIGAYLTELVGVMSEIDVATKGGKGKTPEHLEQKLKKLSDNPPEALEKDQYRTLLGDAYDKMVADGMPWDVVKVAAGAVTVWVQADSDTARRYWASGGRPDPTNRAQRRKKSSSPAT